MNWEIIAKVFGGLLIAAVIYGYSADKTYTEEKIKALEKRLESLEIKTVSKNR